MRVHGPVKPAGLPAPWYVSPLVEITIQSGGMVFRGEKTTADRLDSLEGVTDSLLKQITRNKEKLQKLKTDAKITIGAVIIVRGATFVVNKAISATSLLFDGMGTDKNEIEYIQERLLLTNSHYRSRYPNMRFQARKHSETNQDLR